MTPRPVAAALAAVAVLAGCSAGGDRVTGASGEPVSRRDPARTSVEPTPELPAEDRWFYVVVFEDYPDLDDLAAIGDREDRGRELVRRLRDTARSSQAEAQAFLRSEGAEYRELWLANALAVCTCEPELAERLGSMDGVRAVIGGPDAEVEAADDEPVFPGAPPASSPALAALGVDELRATPDAPDGAGVTVGVVDTGIDGAHPALAPGYRGAPGVAGRAPTHDRNWFDPYGRCRAPCDPQGHGTHVASVAVGRAVAAVPQTSGPEGWRPAEPAVPAVGVAPGARWIGARGCTGTVCDLDELLSALQFMVAPTDRAGRDPDPDLRPDVLVSSWGLREPNPALDRAQRAVEASGIVPVAAAGNEGPECRSVTTPGSHLGSITVGALDGRLEPLAMSGRGPGPTGVQPNVVAVGELVPGALPNRSWGTMTGTSQAAPQVAGLAALLLQARPDLRGDVAGVERRIDASAAPVPAEGCGADEGDPSDNNVTGRGLLSAPRLIAASRP